MALPTAKIVMPERGVEPVRAFKVLNPWNALDGVVLRNVLALEVVHIRKRQLYPDSMSANGCGMMTT